MSLEIRVPHHGGSVPEVEQIFRDYQKKELSERDYFIMSAAWVSANANQYGPAYFPLMPPELENYVGSRIMNRGEENESQGRRLGLWVQSVTAIHEQNRENARLLSWCLEKLGEVELKSAMEPLRRTLERLNGMELPKEIYSKALRCQVLDAESRKRSK